MRTGSSAPAGRAGARSGPGRPARGHLLGEAADQVHEPRRSPRRSGAAPPDPPDCSRRSRQRRARPPERLALDRRSGDQRQLAPGGRGSGRAPVAGWPARAAHGRAHARGGEPAHRRAPAGARLAQLLHRVMDRSVGEELAAIRQAGPLEAVSDVESLQRRRHQQDRAPPPRTRAGTARRSRPPPARPAGSETAPRRSARRPPGRCRPLIGGPPSPPPRGITARRRPRGAARSTDSDAAPRPAAGAERAPGAGCRARTAGRTAPPAPMPSAAP